MPSALDVLPLELWMIILYIAAENSLIPRDECNYITFPELLIYLRLPRTYLPFAYAWQDLRLVCRTFSEILGPSPYFFMDDADVVIPLNARAVYISARPDNAGCFRRLLETPAVSNRITVLGITCQTHLEQENPVMFETLCDRSQSLPSVRCLNLRLSGPTLVTQMEFWERINTSFPSLVCLLMTRVTTSNFEVDSEEIPVIFEKLEILDTDFFDLYKGLRAPRLRHIAFERYSYDCFESMRHSPLLESILIRSMPFPFGKWAKIDSGMFPHLRLIGAPHKEGPLSLPIDAQYLVDHAYVYAASSFSGPKNAETTEEWLRRFIQNLPATSRFTLDCSKITINAWSRSISNLRSVDLRAVGLRMKLAPHRVEGPLIILERVDPSLDKPAGYGFKYLLDLIFRR